MDAASTTASTYAERNRRTGEKRRRKTRARLLDAAIEVISKRGLEAPVIDDFIAAANISRGSFYNYFNTKEELVEAAPDYLRTEMLRTSEASARLIQDPAERLIWSVRRVIRHAGSDPHLGMLLVTETRQITPFDIVVRRAPGRDIRACIAQGRLPRQNMNLAVDFLIGVTREAARMAISLRRPENHAEEAAFLILRGLGMAPEDAQELVRRPLLSLASLDND